MKISPKLTLRIALAIGMVWCGRAEQTFGANINKQVFDTAVRPLFKEHCAECHGAKKQKGGLRADELLPKFDAPDSAARWLKIMERIEAGEMPPKDEERPPTDAVKKVAGWIDANLFAADSERRAREGRGRVRRLNRVEHEYTLHDLFGIDAPLKDLLPEDGMALGFDKVGSALPDGRQFHDVDDFKKLIAANPDRIARCLAEKLIVYATGSGISYADRRALKEIVERGARKRFRPALAGSRRRPVAGISEQMTVCPVKADRKFSPREPR